VAAHLGQALWLPGDHKGRPTPWRALYAARRATIQDQSCSSPAPGFHRRRADVRRQLNLLAPLAAPPHSPPARRGRCTMRPAPPPDTVRRSRCPHRRWPRIHR